MPAPDPGDGQQLKDLSCVFAVNEAIRGAIQELSENPLNPDAGDQVRYLLGDPATEARAAMSRLYSDRRSERPTALHLVTSKDLDDDGGQ